VLIGGAVFPLFGAIYYWFPKITGRMLSERSGKLELLAAVHRLQPDVLPDAHLGLHGMPRRVYTYPAGDGLGVIFIEGTVFLITIASYFYLQGNEQRMAAGRHAAARFVLADGQHDRAPRQPDPESLRQEGGRERRIARCGRLVVVAISSRSRFW
jgi:heme/copper-type cytochrome/quinol oxidase subunit 1